MILGNQAVKVGAYLFEQHILRLNSFGGENMGKKQLAPSEISRAKVNYKPVGEPLIIYSQEKIDALREGLQSKEIPLGKLGVKTKDLYLETDIKTENVKKQHTGALSFIRETSPWMNDMFLTLAKVFVPVGCPEKYGKAGFSSNLAKGFLFYNYADQYTDELGFETAVDYIHETSHQLTFLLDGVDPLIKGDNKALVYSGIKGCDRPAILSLHGAIALAYMSLFRRFHKVAKGKYVFNSYKKLCDEREKLKVTLNELTKNCEFTEVGRLVMNDLEYTLKQVS